MLIDAMSASAVDGDASLAARATAAFLRHIERKLGVQIVRNKRDHIYEAALEAPLKTGRMLKDAGVIQDFGPSNIAYDDEPRLRTWVATCNEPQGHRTGGASLASDSDALYAALAEALERYLWYTQHDYFDSPTTGTAKHVAKKGPLVRPEDFVGFRESERSGKKERVLDPQASYLWIRGTSLTDGKKTFLPAQTVCPASNASWLRSHEPMIRSTTTNGLATSATQTGARLAGALELIERDAYMITWFNQLSLPKLPIELLRETFPEVDHMVAACERYRLKVHVIPLLTDAPTHATAVVLEDASGVAPRFAIGLCAHRSLPKTILKAATEALRARIGYRIWSDEGNSWDAARSVESIGHRERIYYWGVPENAKHLEFLIAGPEAPLSQRAWDSDNEDEHLERIVAWCRERRMHCISVPLTHSKKNPTSWHIEMTVIPQLQPTYLSETLRAFGGARWQEIPAMFGYAPRREPYTNAPHPFS